MILESCAKLFHESLNFQVTSFLVFLANAIITTVQRNVLAGIRQIFVKVYNREGFQSAKLGKFISVDSQIVHATDDGIIFLMSVYTNRKFSELLVTSYICVNNFCQFLFVFLCCVGNFVQWYRFDFVGKQKILCSTIKIFFGFHSKKFGIKFAVIFVSNIHHQKVFVSIELNCLRAVKFFMA